MFRQVFEDYKSNDAAIEEYLSISVDEFTKENFPKDFEEKIVDDFILEKFGTFFSSKEFHRVGLMNKDLSAKAKRILIDIVPCDSGTSQEG